MPKMAITELKSILASEKNDALAALVAAQLSQQRAEAMDYYLGHMGHDMPVQDGRSKAVSTDVADTIEGLMPSLMDIFAGSDEVVRFEPVGPDDEAAATQETDYVNHVFMQQNPGFMVLYSFIKDALLSKVGHRQGLVGRARGGAARDLLRPDRRPVRAAGPGRGGVRRHDADRRAQRPQRADDDAKQPSEATS